MARDVVATQLGRVSSVWTREGRVFVNVQLTAGEIRGVPFQKPFSGGMITPREGDVVEVYQLRDGSRGARFNHDKDDTLPDLGEGELCFRFDGGTEIRIVGDGAGNYDVTVTASGNVNIDAAGSLTFGDAALAEAAAKQAHTHDVTLSDGTTGTTAQPNEAGTSTKIE